MYQKLDLLPPSGKSMKSTLLGTLDGTNLQVYKFILKKPTALEYVILV
jgi:hypothetical protein